MEGISPFWIVKGVNTYGGIFINRLSQTAQIAVYLCYNSFFGQTIADIFRYFQRCNLFLFKGSHRTIR